MFPRPSVRVICEASPRDTDGRWSCRERSGTRVHYYLKDPRVAHEKKAPMKCFSVLPFTATLLVGSATFSIRTIDSPSAKQDNPRQVMLILRGIANAENPRGQLDDEAALSYASRLKFKGEVLDISGNTYSGSPQVGASKRGYPQPLRSSGSWPIRHHSRRVSVRIGNLQGRISASFPANVAVCSVLNPLSPIRTGSGSPSRQISHRQGLNGGVSALAAIICTTIVYRSASDIAHPLAAPIEKGPAFPRGRSLGSQHMRIIC
jgi:hypothetical protein